MGLFGPSDKELVQREQEVERKYTEIKQLLQEQQNVIAARFQDLGNLDASIMTRSNLEVMYKEQLEAFKAQKQILDETIASYNDAVKNYANKQQELAEREQQITARECQASADFAGKLEEQLAPLNGFKDELEHKEQRIILMQDEFNKNFVTQNQKLLADFQHLRTNLQSAFDEQQQKLISDREEIEKRTNALNERESALMKREADVRQGLASERAQMLAAMQGERERLAGADGQLTARREALDARERDIERKENELAERITVVQQRENEATAGFGRQKQTLLAEVQSARDAAAQAAAELQQQASAQCDKMLIEWQTHLNDERNKILAGLTEDIQRERENHQHEMAQFESAREAFANQKAALEKRDCELRLREETLQARTDYLENKEKILNEKFQRIAEERIAAAQAEAQAASDARNALSRRLASVMMELEALKSTQNQSVIPESAPEPQPETPVVADTTVEATATEQIGEQV